MSFIERLFFFYCILYSKCPSLEVYVYVLQESHAYRDPITEFVECLYIKFDFDMAQQKLIECEKVLL